MPTVLIVDDDSDVRELEATVLQANGYRVLTATNGIEALALLETQRPCVILLDLMMPVMDGLTFLRERQLTAMTGRVVPVICVSAGGHQLTNEAIRRGAVHCIPKPTDLDELCATVDKYCGR